MRRIVQLGIEKIRAVDERHGLQVQLLIYLGNSFGSKVNTHYLKARLYALLIKTNVTISKQVLHIRMTYL